MRLWSLHPQYLDRLGLLAVWREGLLAIKVLQNKTSAYKNHPQLERFKIKNGILWLSAYLWHTHQEATFIRNYNFNYSKIPYSLTQIKKLYYKQLKVTDKQLEYEMEHLQKKLVKRDIGQFIANLYNVYDKNMKIKELKANPIFRIVKGEMESWEKI